MTEPSYLTPLEVATRLRVSDRTIKRWIAQGRLPAERINNHFVRIKAADVEALIAPMPVEEQR